MHFARILPRSVPPLLAIPLLFLVKTGSAADVSPAEARLRSTLKQLATRLQTAEADASAAKALQAAAETKAATLQAQLDTLTKESTQKIDAAEKQNQSLQTRLSAVQSQLSQSQTALGKWKEAHTQVSEALKKSEQTRQSVSESNTQLSHRVSDLERKNLTLFQLGQEILVRLEKFSLGTALSAREPFIGLTRVRLENEVRGYKDRLLSRENKP